MTETQTETETEQRTRRAPRRPRGSYAVTGRPTSPTHAALADEICAALGARGFERTEATDAALVINLVDPAAAKPFRRRARGTFVAALWELPEQPDDLLGATYPMLVRALANVSLLTVPGRGVWFTTMERGTYRIADTGDLEALAQGVVERLEPLATSRLVIDNEFRTDLERELWEGDERTSEIKEAGARLGELGLLPNPFPIDDLLNERELRHVKRLDGLGGLSYGNLSARKDARRFWMSASGVDKSKLETPGRDILLVSGYDADRGAMILSVPPTVEPRRVSVDAIEHWMIYRSHPDVGAILHIHAWVDGIAATEINYPCGTEELARSVSDLIDAAPDPGHAIVGLKNHGITATGESLGEILDRIKPRLLLQVPME
ncbi:MAG: class II aldolase/adducin family protein [Actinomycetota bacterium]